MDAHPGVVFVDGPAGRRPVLRRRPGLDIWEIIETVQVNRSPKDAAEYLHLTEQDIEVALAYYAVYRDEIDAWIRDNREMAERCSLAPSRNGGRSSPKTWATSRVSTGAG